MKLLLVGAGGHAAVVAELVRHSNHRIEAYVDRGTQWRGWLKDIPRLASDEGLLDHDRLGALADSFVMGVGGVTPDRLAVRMQLFKRYAAKVRQQSPALVHPSAFVADVAALGAGAMVMPGAIVNPDARVAEGVIVNSGAIIEHDAVVEEGAHIAPGAIVLGGARVGAHAMVGAGAVILPEATVAAGTLVRALTRYGS